MVFKTSNRPNATTFIFPISKPTTNRYELLTAPLTQLKAPGRQPIKQVELYTKYRKFVPLQWRDACCPKPSDEVLNKIKSDKSEKVRKYKENIKQEKTRRIEVSASRALNLATRVMVADNNNDGNNDEELFYA